MNYNRVFYWLLPPIFFRIIKKIKSFGEGAVNDNNQNSDFLEILDELKEKKISYFFDEKISDKFCEQIISDYNFNQPVPTNDKKNQPYLDDLITNGLCVVRGLFDEDAVKKEHDELLERLKPLKTRCLDLIELNGGHKGLNVKEDHGGVDVHFELMSKILRLWNIESVQKNLVQFKENSVVKDICSSYFGNNINNSGIYAEYKHDKNAIDPNLGLHADSVIRQLKVFILLNDIDETNAPLIFFKKSHKLNNWRLLKDFINFSGYNPEYGWLGFSRLEMNKIAQEYPDLVEDETLVTGKAGDVIIVETKGIHGGTSLLDGYRLQLGMVFAALGSKIQ